MSEAENALLPKELHNTKMGKSFAGVIPEINGLNYEQAYVFAQDGKLIAKTNTQNGLAAAFTHQDMAEVQKCAENGIVMGMIHNHTYESTFSAADVLNIFVNNPEQCNASCNIIFAKTPNGYAALQRTKPAIKEEYDWAINLATNEELAQIKLARSCKTNQEIAKLHNEFKNEQYKRFAQKFDHKYEYVTKNFTTEQYLENIPDYKNCYTYENLKQGLLKNGMCENIEEVDDYLKWLDETPLKDFYLKTPAEINMDKSSAAKTEILESETINEEVPKEVKLKKEDTAKNDVYDASHMYNGEGWHPEKLPNGASYMLRKNSEGATIAIFDDNGKYVISLTEIADFFKANGVSQKVALPNK